MAPVPDVRPSPFLATILDRRNSSGQLCLRDQLQNRRCRRRWGQNIESLPLGGRAPFGVVLCQNRVAQERVTAVMPQASKSGALVASIFNRKPIASTFDPTLSAG